MNDSNIVDEMSGDIAIQVEVEICTALRADGCSKKYEQLTG
jgi:hypothetical protein